MTLEEFKEKVLKEYPLDTDTSIYKRFIRSKKANRIRSICHLVAKATENKKESDQ